MTVRCLHWPEGICPRCRYQDAEDRAWKASMKRGKETQRFLDEVKSGELFKGVREPAEWPEDNHAGTRYHGPVK